MTREEAIEIIRDYDVNGCGYCHQGGDEVEEAFDMAIKALSAEPCDDSISRAEAMTEVMMFAGNVRSDEEDVYIKVSDAVQLLRELPPANLQEPCEGCDYKEWLKGEVEPFINKPCVSSGVCEHDKQKVLDKIRAEIEQEPYVSKMEVLDIIDKYKAESEDKE